VARKHDERESTAWALGLLVIAYLTQNFFVFDSVLSYILLMLLLAFLSQWDETVWRIPTFSLPRWVSIGLLGVYVIFAIPVVYLSSVQPAQANWIMTRALYAQNQALRLPYEQGLPFIEETRQYYLGSLKFGTYGNPEFRIQFAQFVDTLISQNFPNELLLRAMTTEVNQELQRQIEEEPKNVASYLLAMRHYNFAHYLNSDYARRTAELFEQAVPLSPERLQLYFEAGYAHLYEAERLKDQGQNELASDQYRLAELRMQRAVDLRPEVAETYINLIMVYLSSGNYEKIDHTLGLMDARGVNYHHRDFLRRLAVIAVSYQEYEYANRFLGELVEKDDVDLQSLIDYALSFAYLGQDEKAIEVAEFVRARFEGTDENVDEFIAEVKSGTYRLPE
jgi:hypothetical protein